MRWKLITVCTIAGGLYGYVYSRIMEEIENRDQARLDDLHERTDAALRNVDATLDKVKNLHKPWEDTEK